MTAKWQEFTNANKQLRLGPGGVRLTVTAFRETYFKCETMKSSSIIKIPTKTRLLNEV